MFPNPNPAFFPLLPKKSCNFCKNRVLEMCFSHINFFTPELMPSIVGMEITSFYNDNDLNYTKLNNSCFFIESFFKLHFE